MDSYNYPEQFVNNKNYINQVGVTISVDCGQDVTTALTYKLEVRRPDGSYVEWQPIISGGTLLQYTTIAGDLSVPGLYAVQPYVVLPNGFNGRGETVFFQVYGYFDYD